MDPDQSYSNLAVGNSLAAKSVYAGNLYADTITVSSFTTTPFDVTGLNDANVVATITLQNSKRAGNIVNIAFEASLNMLVDFTAYPVQVATVPTGVAPSTVVFLPACLGLASPTGGGVFVLSVHPNGEVYTCNTGLPFPVGTYDISVNNTYIK